MKKNEFIAIVKDYDCDIIESENVVEIIAKNNIRYSYSIETCNGIHFISQLKKVACKFVFDELNDIFTGNEETNEILGVFSIPKPTKAFVIEMMKKYNFREKGYIPLV